MRLMRIEPDGDFSLVEHVGNDIPQYAVLSHTWGKDEEEVTYKDLVDRTGDEKPGYLKIRFCAKQAAEDRLQYFWVDTCCIDKSSSTELSEAINSMFTWYQNAAKCYVYLSDVSIQDFAQDRQAFHKSRWFTRGWTLQELVAPTVVEFFSVEGEHIGDKNIMVHDISSCTGLPIDVLQGRLLSHFSFDERMSWTEKRQTKRIEDAAYCLLGMFGICMPLLYGEGRSRAFSRLRKEYKESLESAAHITPSSTFHPERSKQIKRPLMIPTGQNQDNTETLDVSFLLSACKDALEQLELADEPKVSTPREIVVDLESVTADENTTPQVHIRSKGYTDRLMDISSVPQTKTNAKTSIARPMIGGPSHTLKRSNKYATQVDMLQNAINTLSNLAPHIDSETQLVLQSTEDEEQINVEQMHDRNKFASIWEISQLLVDIKYMARQQSQDIVNDWLDVTKYNDRNNTSQYYDKQVSSRLDGTCEWVFSHPEYCTWVSKRQVNEPARILWICAPAGFGKTVLCAKIIEHLKETQSLPIAYFFASPHAQSGGEPTFIIRSWIAQLTQLDQEVLDLVRGRLESGQRASDSSVWSIFKSILSKSKGYTFVLDGLDEYNQLGDVRTEFLEALKGAIVQTPSRILIASREETDIKAALSPNIAQGLGYIIMQCKISDSDVQDDILHFSRSVVDKKLPNKDNRLKEDLAGQLAEKCGGMFLWIKLQENQLRGGKNAKQLQNIVKNMPVGLEKTYDRNWKAIQSHPPEEQSRALNILRWTTFAFRPLTVSEIAEALIIENSHEDHGATIQWDDLPDLIDEEYINSEITSICGDLVEVRTGKPEKEIDSRTVHLIHQSVREFLLPTLSPNTVIGTQPPLRANQLPSQAEQHEDLAIACLSYLNFDDIWHQSSAGQDSELKYLFKHYAVRHWVSHVNAAGKYGVTLSTCINEFLHLENENFGNWRKIFESEFSEKEKKDKDHRQKNSGAASPLYYASLFDLTASMKHIWNADANQINMVGGEYGTPLQAACYKGHKSAFDLLIEWGASPNIEGGMFGVPINAAIAAGHKSMVKTLMQVGANLALQDANGQTPLFWASIVGDSETMHLLIEAGADHAVKNIRGEALLHTAALHGFLEVVQLLLERGADATIKDNDGWTPIYTATVFNRLEIVKLLLEKGAEVADGLNNGSTPLHSAVHHNFFDITKVLLDKGANISIKDENGWSPLKLASSFGYLEIVNLLLERGADVAIVDSQGWTPLNDASFRGHTEVVKVLLENGADVSIDSNDGWTPLNSAANCGHLEIVKLLLEKGADITTRDNNGWTPINSAANGGYPDVVKFLLEKGADLTIPSNDGWTTLEVALHHGNTESVKSLLSACPNVDTFVGRRGPFMDLLTFEGHLEVLKWAHEGSYVNLRRAGSHGQTLLQLAARGGHLDTFMYLVSIGLETTTEDAKGDTLLCYACSGGSLEIINEVLALAPAVPSQSRYWSPLHWACRAGEIDVVERLVEEGLRSNCVAVAGPEDQWSPIAIAIFHGKEEMLEGLSATCRSLLSTEADAGRVTGVHHGGYTCNGCYHDIYGPRFQCRVYIRTTDGTISKLTSQLPREQIDVAMMEESLAH